MREVRARKSLLRDDLDNNQVWSSYKENIWKMLNVWCEKGIAIDQLAYSNGCLFRACKWKDKRRLREMNCGLALFTHDILGWWFNHNHFPSWLDAQLLISKYSFNRSLAESVYRYITNNFTRIYAYNTEYSLITKESVIAGMWTYVVADREGRIISIAFSSNLASSGIAALERDMVALSGCAALAQMGIININLAVVGSESFLCHKVDTETIRRCVYHMDHLYHTLINNLFFRTQGICGNCEFNKVCVPIDLSEVIDESDKID